MLSSFNQDLIEILNKITSQFLTSKNRADFYLSLKNPILKKRPADNPQPFFPATPRDLELGSTDTFLTKNLINKLTRTLGDPKKFAAYSSKQKLEVQQNLSKLNFKEYVWKAPAKSMYDPSQISLLFRKPYKNFKDKLTSYIFPTSKMLEGQRAHQLFFKYRLKTFIEGFSALLVKQGYTVFRPLLSLTDDDFNQIIEHYINVSWIFGDLVRLAVKKSHDNLFSSKQKVSKSFNLPINDSALSVSRHVLVNNYANILALYLMNATFNYLEQNQGLNYDYVTIDRELTRFLRSKQHVFNTRIAKKKDPDFFWGVHMNNVFTIVRFLEQSRLFQQITKDYSRKSSTYKSLKSEIRYVLPVELENAAISFTEFPRIHKPRKIKLEDIDDLIKPLVFGEASVSKSARLQKTLNISQSKKYRINPRYYELLKEFFFNIPHDNFRSKIEELIAAKAISLPFPSIRTLKEQEIRVSNLSDIGLCGAFRKFFMHRIKRDFLGSSVESYNTRQLKSICGGSSLQTEIGNAISEARKKFLQFQLSRRFALTILKLAEILMGFPLYITDTLCSRLRFYPQQPLISRTSGDFKHLLQDYTETKLTISGLVSLLRSYYAPSPELASKFEAFLTSSSKKSYLSLYDFFEKTPLDFAKTKNILYFSLLHMEINHAKQTGKTAVNVEIDQNASGVTLLAYFLRNKKLAEICGLIPDKNGKYYTKGPYIYCMTHFPAFYEKHMETRNLKAFEFILTHRKLHKYALMCFCYSQTYSGRIDDFRDAWEEQFGEEPTKEEAAVLSEFAGKYSDFQDFLFPGLKRQIGIIKEIVALSVDQKGELSVRAPEGEVLTWMFYKHKSFVRTSIDPFSREERRYRLYSGVVDENQPDDNANENIYSNESAADESEESYSNKVSEEEASAYKTQTGKVRLKPDRQEFQKNTLSYIIHCVDAAVMRFFIFNLEAKYGIIISHLHDCIILHPNYVDNFYDEVKLLYESDQMYDMVNTIFFDQIRSYLTPENQVILDEKKAEFFNNTECFRSSLAGLDPRVLYSPES